MCPTAPHDLAPGGAGVAIAGDSAGGNLTAVLARRLRDHGGPAPIAQLFIYPTFDAVAFRQASYPSHRECATGYGLLYADGLTYWDHYLGPGDDPSSPDASPLRAADLSGLPPAYVLTAEYDVLRDEGRAYADRLHAAGVPVTYRQQAGHLHGFLGDLSRYDAADDALHHLAAYLRQHYQDHRSRSVP